MYNNQITIGSTVGGGKVLDEKDAIPEVKPSLSVKPDLAIIETGHPIPFALGSNQSSVLNRNRTIDHVPYPYVWDHLKKLLREKFSEESASVEFEFLEHLFPLPERNFDGLSSKSLNLYSNLAHFALIAKTWQGQMAELLVTIPGCAGWSMEIYYSQSPEINDEVSLQITAGLRLKQAMQLVPKQHYAALPFFMGASGLFKTMKHGVRPFSEDWVELKWMEGMEGEFDIKIFYKFSPLDQLDLTFWLLLGSIALHQDKDWHVEIKAREILTLMGMIVNASSFERFGKIIERLSGTQIKIERLSKSLSRKGKPVWSESFQTSLLTYVYKEDGQEGPIYSMHLGRPLFLFLSHCNWHELDLRQRIHNIGNQNMTALWLQAYLATQRSPHILDLVHVYDTLDLHKTRKDHFIRKVIKEVLPEMAKSKIVTKFEVLDGTGTGGKRKSATRVMVWWDDAYDEDLHF
jgi:hypothetical protein